MNQLAVFDLETTGLDLTNSKIVTASVAVLDLAGELTEPPSEWLANPGVEIPKVAAEVHGVDTEFAIKNGRPLVEVVAEIQNRLQALFDAGIPVVAYNASYDFTILRSNALALGLNALDNPRPIIDPLVLDKKFDRYRKGKRNLGATTEFYGVTLGEDAHNSTADAIAAGRVALAVLAKYKLLEEFSLNQLHDNQVTWSLEQDKSLNEFFATVGKPTIKDFGWPIRAI